MAGTPKLIIAGVRTKAPPEPMNPLTIPPTTPTAKSVTTVTASSSVKLARRSAFSMLPPGAGSSFD